MEIRTELPTDLELKEGREGGKNEGKTLEILGHSINH